MARIFRRIGRSLVQRVAAMLQAWTDFWFAPQDPLSLCVMRCLVGAMVFYTHLIWGLRFEEFFANTNSWQTQELVSAVQADQFAFSFWWITPESWKYQVHCLCLFVLFLFWIGAAARVTSWLAFVITISYAQRVPLATFGLDQINGLCCFYLAIAPCGARLSFDAWFVKRLAAARGQIPRILNSLESRQMTSSTRLATRLLQVHV